MEVFNPNQMRLMTYRSVINQSGNGTNIDRYIYSNQAGEGIGSSNRPEFRSVPGSGCFWLIRSVPVSLLQNTGIPDF